MPKLNDAQVRAAKPAERQYKLYDQDGLFVNVHPNGSKYLRMKYTIRGQEKLLSLGVYPRVSLSKARELAREARVTLDKGGDPSVDRRKAKLARLTSGAATFRVVAEEWFAVKEANASPNYIRDIRTVLNAHLLPKLGPIPISEVDAPILLGALRALESRGKLELTRRCRMWARQILDYATATGRRSGENPARALTADVLRPPTRQNRPALDRKHAGMFLRRLVDYPGMPETRLAATLLLLTAVRPGEIRAAAWAEFDLQAALWRIPAARMKAGKEHVVPLSTQALAALADLHLLTGHSEWLFPNHGRGAPYMSDGTIGKAFRMLLPEKHVVPHGCRAFFSTEANESGKWREDVIEASLAHTEGDSVRAAYNRAEYETERRQLMQWWADQLDAWRAGASFAPRPFGVQTSAQAGET
ncbi:MAG: DUF4102 domain-containing protein [Betaproteobacteria bacterium]|nr:DUF4102 domain-containing protein [Betaproteobacteria bacterium]